MSSERLQDKIEVAVRQYTRNQTNATREAIVQVCQPLARLLANRYTHGNKDLFDDLAQMANLGLIKAIDDFDPAKEVLFTTYAAHKMLGEIRRYLRDKGNHIKIPRRLYEISPRVQATKEKLTRELGHEPTVEQIASASGAPQDVVLEVLQMWYCIEAPSLDAQISAHADGPGSVLADLVGGVDPTLYDMEAYADLRHALTQLTKREREIIVGRYFHEMPQAKLAEQLEISQMHVSRLEKKALLELRQFSTKAREISPMTALAIISAKYVFLLVGLLALFVFWQSSNSDRRTLLLRGIIVLVLGIVLAKVAGAIWFDARPFVRLHTQPLVPHAPDNGFPSDHTLVAFGIAFLLLPFSRKLGVLALVLSAIVAWGRMATLLHSPIDVLASLLFALLANAIALVTAKRTRTVLKLFS